MRTHAMRAFFEDKHQGAALLVAAGMTGAALSACLSFMGRTLSITVINPELVMGSILTHRLDLTSYRLGMILHLAGGGILGWVYGLIFKIIHRTGWSTGIACATAQWVLFGAALGLVPASLALLPGEFTTPGFFWSRLGPLTPILLFIEYLTFGAIVGAVHEYWYDQTVLQNLSPVSTDRKVV
jgi:hypothetical protein